MNLLSRIGITLLSAVSVTFSANAQQPAFPTAQGFGKFATGGRGGKVYTVTNLNDAGEGSFREAFNAYPGEPLTIVFAVGGIIELQSQIKVNRSNFTIAGQTAPGDGICLKGHSFIINGARAANLGGNHGNIIIRYLRSRPGSTLSTGVYGFDLENCHNVVIDHCSFSWANEECAAMYDMENVTVQYSIISEGLFNAGHAKGNRGYGGVWGGQYVSYHHNLFAHLNARSTRFNGARAHDVNALVDYRNNVIYNAGTRNAAAGGAVNIDNAFSRINLMNNYYKPGPATPVDYLFIEADYETEEAKGVGEFHVSGNVMVGSSSKTSDNWSAVSFTKVPTHLQAAAKSLTPFAIAQAITAQTADEAYVDVLKNAGANLPVRDAVDKRVVGETATGTAYSLGITSGKRGIIDMPIEVGGWPTYNTGSAATDTDGDGMPDQWEQTNGLNPNDAADGNTVNAQGYTMLEVYLNSIAPATANDYELMGFAATLNAGSSTTASLSWVVSNDVDVQDFVVERGTDGQNFSTLTTVNSAKSAGLSNYTHTDNNPLGSVSYYRLKLTDINNQVSYSEIKSINNPIASAYWTETFDGTMQTAVTNPAQVAAANLSTGEWLFYGAHKQLKSYTDARWSDGTNPSVKVFNPSTSNQATYGINGYTYFITPIFHQGISKITFNEINRASISASKIRVYASIDGGVNWLPATYVNTAKVSQFDLMTIDIESTSINRLKVVNENATDLNIDNFSVYAPVGITLPLDFVSFTVSLKKSLNSKVSLQWKTENEVNTEGFDIERSVDGKAFFKIGVLPAVNQSGIQSYAFEDQKPLGGISYYRLKQVDLDGKYKYSDVRSINNRLEGQLTLYPNPVINEFTLDHPEASGGTTINLYDISGRRVAAKAVAKGAVQSSLSLRYLPQGIYLLKYQMDNDVITFKVIKQ